MSMAEHPKDWRTHTWRAQGNRCGRGRLHSDTRLRPARPPRGLILSTGEEVPAGQSLRARLVVVEVRPRDVNLERLGDAQEAANQGLYAQAMAGYVCWLAPRLDDVRAKLQSISRERRDRT